MDDEDDVDQDLSIRVCRIMDAIGASGKVRGLYRDSSLIFEILDTIKSALPPEFNKSVYSFGSHCEGTTTKGLRSDFDTVICDDTVDVIDNIEDAAQNGFSLLMVTDENTKPGYFYLQKVCFGIPQTTGNTIDEIDPNLNSTDPFGRICAIRPRFESRFYRIDTHGPAYTSPATRVYRESDIVCAYRCDKVPGIAKAWLYRERPCGWPSQQQLKAMESYGCFFVAVGHPRSPTKSLEWRISFSLQERELMFGLNETQHKCYILLKMIKKDIIHPKAEQSISSYHCKTCLFYAIETSTKLVWTHRNLIKCTRLCLELLLQWVREGNCPNYFIPEENMFDKLDQETLKRVASVLEGIVASGSGFLLDLKCDNVGSLLCTNPSENDLKHIELDSKHTLNLLFVLSIIQYIYFIRNHLIKKVCKRSGAGKNVSSAKTLLKDLQTMGYMECINEFTQEDVQATLDMVNPHMHLQVAQCVTSDILCGSEMHDPNFVSRALVHHFLGCNNVDLISSRLILASFCLKSDRFDICKGILRSCEFCLKDYVISFCMCYDAAYHNESDAFREKVSADGLSNLESVSQIGSQCITGCIVILPSQANLVHKVLHYEMYRSMYTPAGSRDEINDFWFDWIVIDSQVYLYFLQYILYSTNQATLRIKCVWKLFHVIESDPHIGHRETAWNLLGWIFTQEKLFENAFWCFRISLKLQPQHNAAKWHIAFLLHELIYSS